MVFQKAPIVILRPYLDRPVDVACFGLFGSAKPAAVDNVRIRVWPQTPSLTCKAKVLSGNVSLKGFENAYTSCDIWCSHSRFKQFLIDLALLYSFIGSDP